MLQLVLLFCFLAAVIVAAGTCLTRYADAIADLTGLGRSLGGLLLLAAATSLPELAVDCKAALIPAPDLAVGALLGSSLFNLLILSVLDFCHRGRKRIFSHASAHHALAAITTILLTSVVVLFVVLKDFPLQVGNVGIGTLLIVAFYFMGLRLIYFDQRDAHADKPMSPSEVTYSMAHATIGYLASTCVIFVAAHYLAPTADALAKETNLGGTFVGSTFVALTTSLPELVTTAVAVRMGAFDLAVGNVFGSNAFNMAILFPVDVFYRPGSILRDAELKHAMTGGAVIMLTCVATLPLLYRPKKRYWILEPDAALVIIVAVSTLVALYYLTPVA